MSEDNTNEIMAMLRRDLVSKYVLLLTPNNVFSERMIHFYIHSVIMNEKDTCVVWLCLRTSRKHVLEKFEEYGMDISQRLDNMWFIDIEGPGKNDPNTLYCSSRSDYTRIGSHTSRIFAENPGSLLVIDDMSVLSKDNPQVVENFLKYIERTVRDNDGSIISMLGKGLQSSEIEGMMRSFFDVTVDITEQGEMHAEVGLKSLDFRYMVEGKKIRLDYIQRNIVKERLKILIVDDEPDIPELLKLSLSTEPYDFLIAYNGEDAIDIALKEKPDLVLLDIMMPDMDGYEVVEHLKSNPAGKGIAIIMISAKTEVDDKLKGMELGIDDYIAKPFDKREVNARIKMVMKRFGWVPPA